MSRRSGRYFRGLVAAALIAAAATLLRGAAPGPVAAAQTGLSYTSVATWTVDPGLGRVHVALQVTATSYAAGTAGRRYFYSALQLTLPLSTSNYAATDGRGTALPVSVIAAVPSGVIVSVPFRQRLYTGQSTTFELTFDLVDMGGATDRDLRIGQDIISFPISAFGSQGVPGGSVTVVFPAGFIVQEQFGPLTTSTGGQGQTIFSSGPIHDSTALNAWFTASRTSPPPDFLSVRIFVGPLAVTLRYWDDDPGWAAQVERVLVAGYPVLHDLIGLGDPTTKSLTIQEATTQGIGGFSGDYDPAVSLARVSYFADPIVILHETAHMWFNGDLVTDRWIDEGFASFYAEEAVIELGFPDHAPALGPALTQAAVPLNDWTSAGVPGTTTEAYLYGASIAVARRIAVIAGMDGLRHVWSLVRAHTGAYDRPAAGAPGALTGAVDWRAFLDYLEQSTGVSFDSLWQQWVVTPSQAPLLPDRDAARSDYAATQTAAGGWVLPPDIRQAMETWQFGTARALLSQARTVLELRSQIDAAAAAESTTPPVSLQAAFETVSTGAAQTEAQNELAALDALTAARQARIDSKSTTRAVGLLGTDPEADLVAARQAFARGDAAKATSLADSARSAWAGAATVGQIRILGSAAGTAGLLLLIALYIWTRTGRRTDGHPDAAASGSGAADASGVNAAPAEQRDG